MDEFTLIEKVVDELGDRAQGQWVVAGPGDDGAIIEQTDGCQAVASIDTLVSGVHFPVHMPADMVGYRALMVSLSDLAAMAATPRYVLVALTLPAVDVDWVGELARGMAAAARQCDVYICGGNITQGPLSITVSVHGEVPSNGAVRRSGAQVGDQLYISGPLGGAAACVRLKEFNFAQSILSPRQRSYLQPTARLDLVPILRNAAHAAIDVSDGLSKDLEHLCVASGVGANLISANIPLVEGANLQDALFGGDDYEILCSAALPLAGMICIGSVIEDLAVCLDGQPIHTRGYNHFAP